MSEIVFRDPDEVEHIDSEIRRMRAEGLSEDRIAAELGVGKGRVQTRVNAMFRRGELLPIPRTHRVKAVTSCPYWEA